MSLICHAFIKVTVNIQFLFYVHARPLPLSYTAPLLLFQINSQIYIYVMG
ncbi:hypothetical protein HanIR_Chr13g0657951 [Helianthus annuus]|nr:hypothetical protein HanIR_Chr13g0657951 [Helianthus annuus]